MDFKSFSVPGPLLVMPKVFEDDRGYFMEAFKSADFNAAAGRSVDFVQDNQSLSAEPGTVRGLHFQSPPHAQGKLVRVMQGAIIDVAVDARVGSPTYGQFVRVELSADNKHQLWVPEGFLHGFATLVPDTLVFYKVTDVYAPECDCNIQFNDPDLDIDWGLPNDAVLSDKDKQAPRFADWVSPFKFKET